MKVTLVFFEKLSADRNGGFGYASYRLARNLLSAGLLDRVICRFADPGLDFPAEHLTVMYANPIWRIRATVPALLGNALFPNQKRVWQEQVFDDFVAAQIPVGTPGILFLSRPLFPRSCRRAKAGGHTVWVQSAVPHPLRNYTLVRNEEIMRRLPQAGPYSNLRRTERLTEVIALADKILTMAPETGLYTYRSFEEFIDPGKLLSLSQFFTIDPGDYSPHPRSDSRQGKGPVFLHLSHVNLIKGIPYLLKSWQQLQDRGSKTARLIIAGNIDQSVQRIIDRDFPDLPNVEYAGFVADLDDLMSRADVFVSPSISDAGPGTIIEAMASGLPVISSRNCGFASLLTEGKDGFTYGYSDTAQLTKHLQWFADNPDRIPVMSANAVRKVSARSIRGYAEELMDLFRQRLQTQDNIPGPGMT